MWEGDLAVHLPVELHVEHIHLSNVSLDLNTMQNPVNNVADSNCGFLEVIAKFSYSVSA